MKDVVAFIVGGALLFGPLTLGALKVNETATPAALKVEKPASAPTTSVQPAATPQPAAPPAPVTTPPPVATAPPAAVPATPAPTPPTTP